MESYFTSLSKRQTMMLLTALTFGGHGAAETLEHLPDEEAALLKHRAQEILQIPRDRRIPMLVQEMKRLVSSRRGPLLASDPALLVQVLSKERSALREVVVRALPRALADSVRQKLPALNVLPPREVKPEVLAIIRYRLEQVLARILPQRVVFRFSDVLLLQSRELLTVCDRLGARGLGPALAGLQSAERESFLASLPPDQRSLALQAVEVSAMRKLSEKDARDLLKLHESPKGASGVIRSAGVQRLARAALAQSSEFAARLLERHRGDFGQLLQRWVKAEAARGLVAGDGGRSDVVAGLERLASRGVIDYPMRLPPPPPKVAGSSPAPPRQRAQDFPAIQAPPLRPALRPGAPPEGRPSREPGPGAAPRERPAQDLIAQRSARRAGVLTSYAPPTGEGKPPSRDAKPTERPKGPPPPPGRRSGGNGPKDGSG